MDFEFQEVESHFSQLLAYGVSLDSSTFSRLENLNKFLLTLRVCLIGNKYANELIKKYNEMLNHLFDLKNNLCFETKLNLILELEHYIFDIFSTELKILAETKKLFYDNLKGDSKNLSDLLSSFFYLYFTEEEKIKEGLNFELFWTQILIKILNLFNINDNLFSKNLAWRIISDMSIGIRLEGLQRFLSYFFEPDNFKFFHQVSNYYNLIEETKDYDRPDLLEMTCKKVSRHYRDDANPISEGQIFPIGSYGLRQSTRLDRQVIIGKHQSADIKLPSNDPSIDDVSLILRINSTGFCILDCSKACNVKMKLNKDIDYKLEENMILNVAQKMNIKIEVKYARSRQDEENERWDLELILHYLDGPCVGQPKTLKASENPDSLKNTFTLGQGGPGNVPDIFFHLDGYISKLHLEFKYKSNNWYVCDKGSKNGTYILYRRIETYENRLNVTGRLFPEESKTEITLAISTYHFSFRLINN
jgi:FHA domain